MVPFCYLSFTFYHCRILCCVVTDIAATKVPCYFCSREFAYFSDNQCMLIVVLYTIPGADPVFLNGGGTGQVPGAEGYDTWGGVSLSAMGQGTGVGQYPFRENLTFLIHNCAICVL